MTSGLDSDRRLERNVAALLHHGTWVASTVIVVGMVVCALDPTRGPFQFGLNGYVIVKTGIALFIALPIARVSLMLAMFLRARDRLYGMISFLVLVIIAAGILSGI